MSMNTTTATNAAAVNDEIGANSTCYSVADMSYASTSTSNYINRNNVNSNNNNSSIAGANNVAAVTFMSKWLKMNNKCQSVSDCKWNKKIFF